ncbi:PQQ-binding-like beta-propeller repeat protein [Streptomyces sp. NPDC015171]|uniref:protein kinase domain-containing protein n=1 Tax=Streptomyces sp. NPDC015171 TaxID=3364945 RepID=UPI0036FC9083
MQPLRATDPRHIGPYEVLGRLGAGGMGEVYLAASRTGLRLAVKVVRPEYAEDRTFRARFRQEVSAAQTVGGAGTYTARVVDADTEAERPWMATEFVAGPNLRDAVLDHGALPGPAVLILAAALGEALAAIHGKGLVHRDLKPSNILLGPDGPRVIDFGIVRALEATALTRTGAVVGSVGYVSPEQIRNGGQVGPPSDVFSLGAVLAYAAAGREPFGEGQDSVVLLRILTRDFDLSGVPEEVRPLVTACLREDPLKRPEPAEVVASAGFTPDTLRTAARPGWYGPAAWTRPAADDRPSGVEYLAPTPAEAPTAAPAPAGAPTVPASAGAPTAAVRRWGPVAPGRRRLLQVLAGGAAVGGGAWLLRYGYRGESEGSGSYQPPDQADPGVAHTPAAVRSAVLRWQYDLGGIGGLEGACCALSPDGSVVYAGTSGGVLHAVSRDGAKRWKVRLGDDVSTPVATRDGVYCVVGFHSDDVRRLVVVDTSGHQRWTRTLGDQGYAVPVGLGADVLVSVGGTDTGGLRRYAFDGSEKWTAKTSAGPTGTPLVAGDVIYTGSYADALFALDARDGSQRWRVSAGTDATAVALAHTTLFADSAAVRQGFRVSDGRRLWRREDASGALAAGSRTLAVGTESGTVYAVRAADGSRAWTYDIGGGRAEPRAVTAGGTVYVRAGDRVWALDLNGKKRWSAALGRAAGDDQHAPVVGGGRLYIPSGTGIAAVDLGG